MKKIYTIITLVLWSCVQTIDAQNMYRCYQTSMHPNTTASVVHSNGYVYFFQADGNGYLSATEINPLSMNPTGISKSFQITMQNFSSLNFYLNGGFEDSNGNFVLFGFFRNYVSPNSFFPCPAYIIIPSNLAFCVPYYFTTQGSFTSGCTGHDVNGVGVYMFVSEGELVVTNHVILNQSKKISLPTLSGYQDQYTDISWDSINEHFIATGSARNSPSGHEDPFVEVFNIDFSSNFLINSFAEYIICDPYVTHSSEYKSLHVQLDDNNLILYHDLERYQNTFVYDIIWLTRIKNFGNVNTAIVDESWLYELQNAKIFAKDMLFDPYNKRLNLLNYFNYCKDGLTQLLAQVDPYGLFYGIEISQLGSTFTGGWCTDLQDTDKVIFYNDLEMFNISLNYHNPCYPVLIAGVDNNNIKSLLTETYDISISSCDVPMLPIDKPSKPALISYMLNPNPQPFIPISGNSSNSQDGIIVYYVCDEGNACSHQFGGKSRHQSLSQGNTSVVFTFEENYFFVCEGLIGEIQYFIYNIAGKLLHQGITRNGERNVVKESRGMYLLHFIDSIGNRVVKKIVLL